MAMHRMRLAAAMVALGAVTAFAAAGRIDEADEATRTAQGQGGPIEGEEDDGGVPSGPSATGLVGFWSGGECVLTASSEDDRAYDVSGAKKEPQMFPLIVSQRPDGQLQVDPHPMDEQLGVTLTYQIEGDHVHAEEVQDKGELHRIRDFTLQGDKLVGTYTTFHTRARYRKDYRCELPKM